MSSKLSELQKENNTLREKLETQADKDDNLKAMNDEREEFKKKEDLLLAHI